jgi:hypothetical protein
MRIIFKYKTHDEVKTIENFIMKALIILTLYRILSIRIDKSELVHCTGNR